MEIFYVTLYLNINLQCVTFQAKTWNFLKIYPVESFLVAMIVMVDSLSEVVYYIETKTFPFLSEVVCFLVCSMETRP